MKFYLDDVLDDIYGEVVGYSMLTNLSDDIVVATFGGFVHVCFFIYLCYTDGTSKRSVITRSQLDEWNIGVQDLVRIAGASGGELAFEDWSRIAPNVYRYPDLDNDWVAKMLVPTEIAKANLKGDPLLMIPCDEVAIVCGGGDVRGQTTMLRECLRITDSPITPRPMRLDIRALRWEALADKNNLLAHKYRRAFL